ncbi:MAG: hypothetical protein R3F11_21510 [Verrucomicrobiales bacterium]
MDAITTFQRQLSQVRRRWQGGLLAREAIRFAALLLAALLAYAALDFFWRCRPPRGWRSTSRAAP